MIAGGKLLRAGGLSLAQKVGGVGLGMLTTILLARELGPSEYGEYAYVFALATLVAIPAQLGLPNLVVRETARALTEQRFAHLLATWRWAHRIVALISIMSGVAMLAFALLTPSSDMRFQTVLWALPLVPLIALGNIRGAALRGLGMVNLGQLPELILRPSALLIFLASALSSGLWLPLTAPRVMAFNSAAALISFVVGSYWLIRHRPATARPASPAPAEIPRARAWLASSIILGLVAGLQTFNSNADALMLGLLGNNTDVGVYKVATTISAAAAFVLTSLNVVAMPRVVTLLQNDESKALQQLVRQISRLAFGAALLALIALALTGTWLLKLLFGPAFVAAYPALLMLTLGHTVSSFFGPVALLLNMANRERDTLKGVALGAAINIASNLALIPILGGLGAASATTLSIIIWNAFLYVRVRQRLGIDAAALSLFRNRDA